jgi:hypothetical protein
MTGFKVKMLNYTVVPLELKKEVVYCFLPLVRPLADTVVALRLKHTMKFFLEVPPGFRIVSFGVKGIPEGWPVW